MLFELAEPIARANGSIVTRVHVTANLETPWRTAHVWGANIAPHVVIELGYKNQNISTVFTGDMDLEGKDVHAELKATARGLKAWRNTLEPQGFMDVSLAPLCEWIAKQAGATLQLNTAGEQHRHYSLHKSEAWHALKKSLQAWDNTSVLVELDNETLYVGSLTDCPHHSVLGAELVRGLNISELKVLSGSEYRITTPAMPWLRLLNKVKVEHPLLSGTGYISGYTHIFGEITQSILEVKKV